MVILHGSSTDQFEIRTLILVGPTLPFSSELPYSPLQPLGEFMTINIKWAGLTHVGLVREHNEDNFFFSPDLNVGFVADGMGGHHAGEVASAIAVETMRKSVEDREDLDTGLIRAHQAILTDPRGGGVRGMGTTGVGVRIRGRDVEVAWVGDSRAYLWQDQALLPLTKDHTPVQEMLDRGIITPEQARTHQNRNEITQALGVAYADIIYPGRSVARLSEGDAVLLCSDGLTEHLNDAQLARIFMSGGRHRTFMSGGHRPEVLAERFVEEALDDGGSDNITVVIAKAYAP